jgi:hypothetical protein
MLELKIGLRRFGAVEWRVRQERERLFRMQPEQRRHRVDAAKSEIARLVNAGAAAPALARPVAILLSAGIEEI